MNLEQLRSQIRAIDHKGYPACKDLRGRYDCGNYQISIDHVQGDPFASPSGLSARIGLKISGFPEEYLKDRHSRTAIADRILRRFCMELDHISHKVSGSGASGLFSTSHPGQEILERSACEIRDDHLVLRFLAGFPARGRTIDGRGLEKMLCDLLPPVLEKILYYRNWNPDELRKTYELAVDQQYIRSEIRKRNLAAFVADGSILPRQSGVSDKPMKDAVRFVSPESLKVTMDLPYAGKMEGMGIPEGVTLIVGGGYHGKSTLLKALQNCVYDHIRGDGREYVITDETAVKIRAEEGRYIHDLDISPFIHDLPDRRDTQHFCTEDASGSTSQAAAVMESMESGARMLMIDEDTSATNFLVRDELMKRVVSESQEPITPLVAYLRELYEKQGISTIIVAGSSGVFFGTADTVLQMDAYRPYDIKEKTDRLLKEYPVVIPEGMKELVRPESRPCPVGPFRGRTRKDYHGNVKTDDRIKCRVSGKDGFSIDRQYVDLRLVEQIADSEQVAALAGILRELLKEGGSKKTCVQIAEQALERISQNGISVFCGGTKSCGLAAPRKQEILSMIFRYRG